MAGLRAILFDLGDTLLDFGPVDTLGLFEQGARLTYAYLKELKVELPTFSAYHRQQLRAIRWAYLKSHLLRREFNSLDVIQRVALTMNHDLPWDRLEELAWLWYEPLSLQATVEPSLPEILGRFAEEGIKLGVISNTFIPGAVLDRHLQQEGLLAFLPTRVYSCDVRYRKPQPEIFRHALKRLGLTAAETMFVGDSPRADIYGARKLGMVAVLKDPAGTQKPHRLRPCHTVRSLGELPEIAARYM